MSFNCKLPHFMNLKLNSLINFDLDSLKRWFCCCWLRANSSVVCSSEIIRRKLKTIAHIQAESSGISSISQSNYHTFPAKLNSVSSNNNFRIITTTTKKHLLVILVRLLKCHRSLWNSCCCRQYSTKLCLRYFYRAISTP